MFAAPLSPRQADIGQWLETLLVITPESSGAAGILGTEALDVANLLDRTWQPPYSKDLLAKCHQCQGE